MRWMVFYQKGSFHLRESYEDRDAATRRLEILARDDTVWSIEVRDMLTGASRLVSHGASPRPLDAFYKDDGAAGPVRQRIS